ncbi:MAG: hypothetical protein U5L96_03520 [Owenweeksia sp.]|nr:hypothetical protein [Owenweeksia sp.]
MRLNSSRASKILLFVYLLCIFVFLFDILIINIDGSWGSLTKLTPVAVAVVLLILYRGLPQFLYDSDGEVLNFTAREPNLSFLGNRFVKHVEFPKRKLDSYKILRYPFKRKLQVYIRSKENHLVKQSMNISYLNSREVRDLKRSLDRVMMTNGKKKHARRA